MKIDFLFGIIPLFTKLLFESPHISNTPKKMVFDVRIIDDKNETAHMDEKNYVELPHNTEYKVRLYNGCATRCDAEVEIDGKVAGVFRIAAKSFILIDRPANEARHLTFLRDTSKEATESGIRSGESVNGVIRVTFRPERQRRESRYFGANTRTMSLPDRCGGDDDDEDFEEASMGIQDSSPKFRSVGGESRRDNVTLERLTTNKRSSGATGLGSASLQKFHDVSRIVDIDQDLVTIVKLRLVVVERTFAPLRDMREPTTPPPIA